MIIIAFLELSELSTNQVVGSSNLSGRANRIRQLDVNSANCVYFFTRRKTFVVAFVVALNRGFEAVGRFA